VSIHEGHGAPHSRRRYLRLRAGPYRITYTIKGDLITILRVERRGLAQPLMAPFRI